MGFLPFRRKKSDLSENSGTSKNTTNQGGPPGVSSVNGNTSVFRVKVPENVRPGEEFQVYAGNRIVRVRCPPNTNPGQSLQITVPTDPDPNVQNQLPPDSPGVRSLPGTDPQAYMVAIPDGVQPGSKFTVQIQGQQLQVTCPENARPGMSVRIVPPPPPAGTDTTRPPAADAPMGRGYTPPPKKEEKFQLFEVEVPKGVQPGSPFALLAGGVRVLVTCPPNARPGQRIRFKLPLELIQKPKDSSEQAELKLKYDKDGWMRTVRATDLKFQWVRMDDNGDIDRNRRFQMEKSAYVRKIDFYQGSNQRLRDGILSLVPATEVLLGSKIKDTRGKEIVTYSDLAEAQVKSFDDKATWFHNTCAKLSVSPLEGGHITIRVRREHLLVDSINAIMSLAGGTQWSFTFIGEEGLDAGGVAREWFELVCTGIFDPDRGLWMSSTTNQMSMTINPASSTIYGGEDLAYFRFMGRVIGRALFDRQIVKGHMVKHIYKHILGWPIQFKDLESLDVDYYRHLRQIAESGDEIFSILCLDFTASTEIMGVKQEIELVKGGRSIDVDSDNFPEYAEACMKYKLLDCMKPQLNALLLGFYDVIPETLLTIFDFQELELLMCGLPNIDLEDWKRNTEYSGTLQSMGQDHQVCQWFWEVVESLDQEMRARLLQFATGTSGVPARGFGVLQGNNGSIRKFTIEGVKLDECMYPRAITCFNRIDLPMYRTKEDLEEKLKLAVTMSSTGFDLE
eukprot:CAMPEP_0176170230 /NCGR_PEP_ID=MMETSP0120_2-20121206/87153_1 /TAXON_ID=160619 /ORGANISM="Kryptoperidinium foliaceum, Strain CCMP 1326" /LENGTH=733 /DNA_ID=CAMNT_0017508039 /DNA_START=168 /DNA_END=2371 /DNA_ORIENTATION=-